MTTRLYVGNLDYNLDEEQLAQHFAQVGTVVEVTIVRDRTTRRSRGFGFVQMSNSNEAKAAIEKLDGSDLAGRKLIVAQARPRKQQ